jgi:hypothetical protein
MDSTPLLGEDTLADPHFLPRISPSPAPAYKDSKNKEPGVSGPSSDGGSKKRAEATDERDEVLSPGKKEERRAWFSRLRLPPFVGGRAATDAREGTSDGKSASQEGKRDCKINSLLDRTEHFAEQTCQPRRSLCELGCGAV